MDMALVSPESASIHRLVMDGRILKGMSGATAAFDGPARGRGGIQSLSGRVDLVDVSGLEAIGEAIRQYRGQEALPIPESVGRAIRSLVQEVLDGLPHKGVLSF